MAPRKASLRVGRPVRPRSPIDTGKLRAERVARDMSGRAVAERLTSALRKTVIPATYHAWETGVSRPPADVLAELESMFGPLITTEE